MFESAVPLAAITLLTLLWLRTADRVLGGCARLRELVLRRLIKHARLHPEREVLLKVRGKVGEHTTHAEHHPYQQLGGRLGIERPDNLTIVHGNMGEVLDRTDLLVTVSSTAAVEAMHRGIPTAILTDFGLKERLGNHYFIGSGSLAGFTELDGGALPLADPVWTRSRGLGPSDAVDRARSSCACALWSALRYGRGSMTKRRSPGLTSLSSL